MKRSHRHILSVALSVLLICLILVPCVSAAAKATKTPTPTATVPPILQACSQATYPVAGFNCSFPGGETPQVPEGPPYTIKCYDNSSTRFNQSVVSWKWDFGDGGTSNDQNPEHTYSEASMYDIRLTVATFCGSQYSNTTTGSFTTYCSVPEPAFTTNVTEGYAPLAVAVTDTSLKAPSAISQWTYWFDDTHSSTERNPVFMFSKPGIYMINQSISKTCVQLGSRSYPPAFRRILVKSPATEAPVNQTTAPAVTTPAVQVTSTPAPVVTAAPAQAESNTGTLSVTSEPPGAQVFIDEVLKGTTPADVPGLSAGAHTLRLEHEGYQSMSMAFSVRKGQTTTLSTSLMPVPGGIALLPVIILSVIVLFTIVGGAYLYLRQRAMNNED